MNDIDYLEKLKQERATNRERFHTDNQNRKNLEEIGRDEEPEYTASTYLYIRSTEDDRGDRQLPPDTVFWSSPDIIVQDRDGNVVTSSTLEPNRYFVQVNVFNDGDHDCHSAAVELHLANPSIGFSVAAAEKSMTGNINISRRTMASIKFPLSVDLEDKGHKCLFARTYSHGTNDYPVDFVNLNSLIDRHVAQRNIIIVKQDETIPFNIIRPKEWNSKLEVVLMQYKPQSNITEGLKLTDIDFQNLNFGITKLSDLNDTMEKALKRSDENSWVDYEIVEGINKMKIYIPSLDLKDNEAAAMNIIAKDLENEKTLGGITFLIIK